MFPQVNTAIRVLVGHLNCGTRVTREQFGAHESVVGEVLVERPVEPGRLDAEYLRLRHRVDGVLGD